MGVYLSHPKHSAFLSSTLKWGNGGQWTQNRVSFLWCGDCVASLPGGRLFIPTWNKKLLFNTFFPSGAFHLRVFGFMFSLSSFVCSVCVFVQVLLTPVLAYPGLGSCQQTCVSKVAGLLVVRFRVAGLWDAHLLPGVFRSQSWQ